MNNDRLKLECGQQTEKGGLIERMEFTGELWTSEYFRNVFDDTQKLIFTSCKLN